MDLYSLFKQGDNYAESDQIFQVISLADVEVADCAKVIDLTKCSFSMNDQDKIHVLLETAAKVKVVRQYALASLQEKDASPSLLP